MGANRDPLQSLRTPFPIFPLLHLCFLLALQLDTVVQCLTNSERPQYIKPSARTRNVIVLAPQKLADVSRGVLLIRVATEVVTVALSTLVSRSATSVSDVICEVLLTKSQSTNSPRQSQQVGPSGVKQSKEPQRTTKEPLGNINSEWLV